MTGQITEYKKRAEAYSKSRTFTYVKEVVRGRESFYNGFVVEVHSDMIVFFDIVLKKEFPVRFESIKVIEPSRKDIELRTAFDIWRENGGPD